MTAAQFSGVSQLVVVEPGASYRLRFWVRFSALKSASTPLVQVVDATHPARSLAVSKELPNGTGEWEPVALEFNVPSHADAVTVRIVRQSCGKRTALFSEKFGMTSSIFNASAAPAVVNSPTLPDAASTVAPTIAVATPLPVSAEPVRTLASRFIILMMCIALVLSALAFGTVHSWSLGALQASAGAVVFFWYVDGWRSKRFRISRNVLQWPLFGLVIIGLVQLLPLGGGGGNIDAGFLSAEPVRSLSLEPYTTRLVVVQIASLLVYFAAALAFIDTPRRLRLIARVIIIFGFLLAMFSMMQFVRQPR